MIDALRKLDAANQQFSNGQALAQPAIASLHIIDPMPNSWWSQLLNTHPPIHKRISRLQAIDTLSAADKVFLLSKLKKYPRLKRTWEIGDAVIPLRKLIR